MVHVCVGDASQYSSVGDASQYSSVGDASQYSSVGDASQYSSVGDDLQRGPAGEPLSLLWLLCRTGILDLQEEIIVWRPMELTCRPSIREIKKSPLTRPTKLYSFPVACSTNI